jgi:hypothetical protein
MLPAMNKQTAFALAIAAATALNLAAYGPASARVQSRMQAYTEGLWKEPAKPSVTVEPPASVRGGSVRTEPLRGSAGKPQLLSPMPR